MRVSVSTDGKKGREANSPEGRLLVGLGQLLFPDIKFSKHEMNGKGTELAWVQDPLEPWVLQKETQWLL